MIHEPVFRRNCHQQSCPTIGYNKQDRYQRRWGPHHTIQPHRAYPRFTIWNAAGCGPGL